MKQRISHGAEIDALTPGEAQAILDHINDRDRPFRVRATATVKLDATGAGQDEVYSVPAGFEFEARRISLDLDSASDPATGNVPLNVAGRSVEYLSSGTRIEYASPASPVVTPQVPGVQVWGAESGPYLRNGEIFEVRARGLTPNATLLVRLEGVLKRPTYKKD